MTGSGVAAAGRADGADGGRVDPLDTVGTVGGGTCGSRDRRRRSSVERRTRSTAESG
jgi:hypothetical protein